MRIFLLDRKVDESGVSGSGIVAEGIEFGDGTVVLHWITQVRSTTVYKNME